ncbi:hypothetical protein KP509_14G039400 [Ceratopteris richardii]|uniref:Uncharacterized protein n=1 Tax=Ceratopteris richardii TaxID=49495 RepID=A0A8T2T951_CERRI|nr:hypothetical protein KP509_14G039400 [Ceratopteris richardii]
MTCLLSSLWLGQQVTSPSRSRYSLEVHMSPSQTHPSSYQYEPQRQAPFVLAETLRSGSRFLREKASIPFRGIP